MTDMRRKYFGLGTLVPLVFVLSGLGAFGASAQTQTRPQTPVKAKSLPVPKAEALSDTATASTQKTTATSGEIVARIAGTDLREDELRSFVAGLPERDRTALARDPSLLSQIVRTLLANQLVLKEANDKHWDQRADIAEQLRRVREIAIVDSYLKAVTQPAADFPSEAAVQGVYDANKSAFLVPRQFLIAQIFVAMPNNADKATTEKATKKLGEVQFKLRQPTADFADIVRTDTDAKEAADRGGEIGWLPESQLRPEIKAQVLGLAKAAVSDPIRLDDGWHILKLMDTKPAYTRPLTEVRDQLVDKLRTDQVAALKRAYLAEILKRNPPAINELALGKVLSPVGQSTSR